MIECPSKGTTISFKKMIKLGKHESIPLKHTCKSSICVITTSKHKRWEAEREKKNSFSSGITQNKNIKVSNLGYKGVKTCYLN